MKYTNKKWLGKGKHKIGRSTKPMVKKSNRKPVTLGRTIKKEVNYNGPTATCAQVESCVLSNTNIESWVNNLINTNQTTVSINADIIDLLNRVDVLETAWYITCADLSSCPDFISLEDRIADLENESNYFYQEVYTIGGGLHTQRDALWFWPWFIITDNPWDNRTDITIDPAYLGWGGSVTDTNNYVTAWSYSDVSKLITLSRIWLSDVTIDMSSISTADELVKVGSTGTARYLNTDDFVDSWFDIEVKKQMSIISDSAWLKLYGDELTPWANMLYGTDGSWAKGRVPNNDAGQLSYTVTLQNTLVVNHWLDKFPSVVCVNSSWELIEAEVTYTDSNNFTVDWTPVFTGTVYLT